jgi:subtilisin family serine protease
MHVLSSFPGSTYEFEDGTSMAGPHVVGVVALLWSANPNLIGDINRTTQILRESATPFTGTLAPIAATEAPTNTNAPNREPNVLDQLETTSANNACLTRTNIAITPNNVTGYGIVNAYKAVKLALGKP